MGTDSDQSGGVKTDRAKPAPSWLGRRVGRFKLLALIGQGSMGRVFRAEDVSLQRQVALKILPGEVKLGGRTIQLAQFVREARSAATLEHPGAVHIYEINQSSDIYYIAMELVEGGNLRELVKASGPMDFLRACQLTAEAAETLDAAHTLGIVHRDIKPSNLMLTRAGRCKVADFGLARIDDPNDTFHIGTEAVGTPLYVAPEIARGMPATGASDIYSLAATLCYLLTGRPPFVAASRQEILRMHLESPPPDLRVQRPDLPEGLAAAIHRAMAKKPEDRFESAGQFAKVLRIHTIPVGGSGASGLVASSSGAFGAPGAASAGDSQASSNRKLLLLLWGAVAAIVLIGLGVAAWIYMGSTPNAGLAAAAPPASGVNSAADDDSASSPPVNPQILLKPTATFQATDTELMNIASGRNHDLAGKPVAVVGTVSSIHASANGKSMHVEFVGVDDDKGFSAVYPDTMSKSLRDHLGPKSATGLGGQKVRVVGVVTLHKTRPEIKIDSASQIDLN